MSDIKNDLKDCYQGNAKTRFIIKSKTGSHMLHHPLSLDLPLSHEIETTWNRSTTFKSRWIWTKGAKGRVEAELMATLTDLLHTDQVAL